MGIISFAKKAIFAIKPHAPVILFGIGVAAAVASTVFACKATLKFDEALEEIEKKKADDISKADEALEKRAQIRTENEKDPNEIVIHEYDENDYAEDMAILNKQYRGKTLLSFIKCYKWVIIFMIASLTSLGFAFKVLYGRYAAVNSLLAATTAEYAAYRGRVLETEGEAADNYYRFGVIQKELELPTGEIDEVGNDILEKKTVNFSEKELPSKGAFGPFSYRISQQTIGSAWHSNMRDNLINYENLKHWAENKLVTEGHVWLHDILKEIGDHANNPDKDLREAKTATAGWKVTFDENGTPYVPAIDFGLNDVYTNASADDYNKELWLVFNCEPNILSDDIYKYDKTSVPYMRNAFGAIDPSIFRYQKKAVEGMVPNV